MANRDYYAFQDIPLTLSLPKYLRDCLDTTAKGAGYSITEVVEVLIELGITANHHRRL